MCVTHYIRASFKDVLKFPIICEETPMALKHLINIVRCILRSPSVVLCEFIETSNQVFVEGIISNELVHSTRIFINPHLGFLEQCDRIVFLSHGKVIDNDHPAKIFDSNHSQFAKSIENTEPLQFLEIKKRVSNMPSIANIPEENSY